MLYRAIGIMSGSSLDGLDMAYVEFNEQAGKWSYVIRETACLGYSKEWGDRLKNAVSLSALEYQLLHTGYGHYIGQKVNEFIQERGLLYQVGLVASHGHTSFHIPAKKMTAQLGDGAAIAAETGLPVVTDLRALDVAFGGQGAPIVPVGEKLLMPEYDLFLNIGGIANLSSNGDPNIAFDICPANRVLNMLANETGKEFDENGQMAASGTVHAALLGKLDALDYYRQPYPKSLANDFGTELVYPLLRSEAISIPDALRTCCEHIAIQAGRAIATLNNAKTDAGGNRGKNLTMLVTGGGAFNSFLVGLLDSKMKKMGIEVVIPDPDLVNYKEALIMAFIGVLRWRQEYNVLSSVTGASRNSIGGALWTGQEA